MNIKELLDLFGYDIITYDSACTPGIDEQEILCRFIKKAKCKQSEFLHKLYTLVNVVIYSEIDGKEMAMADWSGFINHNKDRFKEFTDIWGSKLIRLEDDKGLVPLWMEQFNHMSIASVEEDLCMDLIKLMDSCEKPLHKSDGIVAA